MRNRAPRIILPGEFSDSSGLRRIAMAGPERIELPAGVVIEPGPVLFARMAIPSFADHFHPYLTLEEIARYIDEPLPFRFPDNDRVIETVRGLPFEAAMRWTALVQRAVTGRPPDDQGFQETLVREVYLDRLGELFVRALRGFGGQAVAISEPQLFALQRLLVLHARDDAAELTRDEHVQLRIALAGIPGTFLKAADDDAQIEEREAADVSNEDWLRFFIGAGGLTHHAAFDHALARSHRIYHVIANSSAARQHRDYCPFDEWLQEAYDDLGFLDLQAAGLAFLAGSKMFGGSDDPPLLIGHSYLDPTRLADKIDTIFDAIAADRTTLKGMFERSPQTARRQAREILPFLRFPALRQEDGQAMILSPRAIQNWLSPAGTYWRLFHIAEGKGRRWKDRFFRFHGFLHERYVLHLAYVAHPDQPRRRLLRTAGVVHPEIPYAQEGTSLTSDVIIDQGTDLVLIEATAKRLTVPSTLDADTEKIEDDLDAMIVEKAGQLGRVMRDIGLGAARLDGIDPNQLRTFWPVIITPENALQTPSLWAWIERECAGLFDLPRPECQQVVKPLVLLEIEEYERLMGLVQEGASLVAVLERKTEELWRHRDLKAMLNDDIDAFGSGESEFIQDEWHRAFRSILGTLALPDDPRVRRRRLTA